MAAESSAFRQPSLLRLLRIDPRRRERLFARCSFRPVDMDGAQVDMLGESTRGDLSLRQPSDLRPLLSGREHNSSAEELAKDLLEEHGGLLDRLGARGTYPKGSPVRGIFCSRTLNFRSISTIGYDMDFTLINYDVTMWETRAYAHGLETLRQKGVAVEGLRFEPSLVMRGLIIDRKLGNVVKADRFGYVKRSMHGTRFMSPAKIAEAYGRTLIDLRNPRWTFLNTLFTVAEAVLYMQLVDRLDEGGVPTTAAHTYAELHGMVSKALTRANVEDKLKQEVLANPEKFVELDPDLPPTLLDQKEAGKRLLLITNSDYEYTSTMMSYSFDRFLPGNMEWRNLFDMVIVSARKPDFFSSDQSLYEVVTDDGLMRPCDHVNVGGLYCGGSARMVEKALGVSGDEFLYVGDHIYTDVSVAKINHRWRTCLILRELEEEVRALNAGRDHREGLKNLMNMKEKLGDIFSMLRLVLVRRKNGRCFPGNADSFLDEDQIEGILGKLLVAMERLDADIAPMLVADGEHFNPSWGYLSRAGLNDKSHLQRQIEKYADIYTSRVSNFLRYTPFMYFRSPSQSLAHDRIIPGLSACDSTDLEDAAEYENFENKP